MSDQTIDIREEVLQNSEVISTAEVRLHSIQAGVHNMSTSLAEGYGSTFYIAGPNVNVQVSTTDQVKVNEVPFAPSQNPAANYEHQIKVAEEQIAPVADNELDPNQARDAVAEAYVPAA